MALSGSFPRNPVASDPLLAGEDGFLTFQVTTTLRLTRAQPPRNPACCGVGGRAVGKGLPTPGLPTPSPASVSPTQLSSLSRGEFPCKILFEQSFPPLQTLYKPVIQPATPLAASRGLQSSSLGLQPIYSTHELRGSAPPSEPQFLCL